MSEEIRFYKVNHSFKDTIIVPLVAVTKNIEFILNEEDKYIVTADDVKCKVRFWRIRNIFDIQDDIQNRYKISAWDFLKRWHSVYVDLSSIDFFVIGLEKMS